jgi:hypothetical protein
VLFYLIGKSAGEKKIKLKLYELVREQKTKADKIAIKDFNTVE